MGIGIFRWNKERFGRKKTIKCTLCINIYIIVFSFVLVRCTNNVEQYKNNLKEIKLIEYDMYETLSFNKRVITQADDEEYYLYFEGNIDFKNIFNLKMVIEDENKILIKDTIDLSPNNIKRLFYVKNSIYKLSKIEYKCFLKKIYLKKNKIYKLKFSLLHDYNTVKILQAKIIISNTELNANYFTPCENNFVISTP